MAMAALITSLYVFIFFTYTLQTTPDETFYWAAVVEYHGSLDTKLSTLENYKKNAESHAKIIKKAKDTEPDLDIIVFPELGLLGFDNSLFIEIPDPESEVIPATNDSFHEVLRTISKAAIDNNVYVLVNLHESYKNETRQYKFNSNVVFSRTGKVIARYRKYNLFEESFLDRPQKPEYVTFDTDFGVEFGTFICFDLMFEEPAMGLVQKYNITDIVFSAAWLSELPFHYGVQEQSAWAYANDVNLLASGYNNLTAGNSGSGIYAGRKGPIIYVEDGRSGSRILIGKVPKMSEGESDITTGQIVDVDKPELENEVLLKEDISLFKSELITPEKMKPQETEDPINVNNVTSARKKHYFLESELCDNNFCCNFTLKFSAQYYQDSYNFDDDISFNKLNAFNHYRYRLIAFNGTRNYFGGIKSGEQLCAIMPCLDDSLDSCAKSNPGVRPKVIIKDKELGEMFLYSTEFNSISISGYFHNIRTLYLPSVLLTSYEDTKLLNSNQIEFETIENITDNTYVSLTITNLGESDPSEEGMSEMGKFASGGILARLFERDVLESTNSGHNLQRYSVVLSLIFYLINFF